VQLELLHKKSITSIGRRIVGAASEKSRGIPGDASARAPTMARRMANRHVSLALDLESCRLRPLETAPEQHG